MEWWSNGVMGTANCQHANARILQHSITPLLRCVSVCFTGQILIVMSTPAVRCSFFCSGARLGCRFCGVQNGVPTSRGHLLESERLHGIGGPALRQRTDGGRIAEHLRQRNLGIEDGLATLRLDAGDCATPSVNV